MLATLHDASSWMTGMIGLRSCIRDGRPATLVCGTLGGETRNRRPKTQEAHADTWERAATQSDILSYRCREQSHRGEQPE